MKKFTSFSLIFLLSALVSNAQFAPIVVGTLPNALTETSGLEVKDSISLWSHNDSGGENKIFVVNHTAQVTDSFTIVNATNTDWEDLAKDDATGKIFIGDFGNNAQDRTDLKIYIVNPDTVTNNNRNLQAEIISFTYPDQAAFPPSNNNHNFDCEAMFFANDSLYLISKNTSTTGTGYGKLYRLPCVAGNYTAELTDSFHFAEPITAADISPQGNKLIVMGYLSVFTFSGFSNHNYFDGTVIKKSFTSISQKEAIVFATDSDTYISDESAFGVGRKLYHNTINQIIYSGTDKTIAGKFFFLYPNPSEGSFFIKSSEAITGKCDITIMNCIGKIVFRKTIHDRSKIDVSDLADGLYMVEILSGNKRDSLKLIVQH